MARHRNVATIEATQFDGTLPSADALHDKYGSHCTIFEYVPDDGGPVVFALHVTTKEWMVSALPGYWIAEGIEGEIWPIAPDVFAKTYVLCQLPPSKDGGLSQP